MPFSIQLTFGADQPVIFEGWLDESLKKFVPKGTAFGRASAVGKTGIIVTNGPMFISSTRQLEIGATIEPGEIIAYGAANGEDIPYGKPYCKFVADNP